MYQMLLVIDPAVGMATPLQLPSLDGTVTDASVFNDKMFPHAAVLRGGVNPVTVVQDRESTLACWCAGENVVALVDVRRLNTRTITLAFAVQQVVSLEAGMWLLGSSDATRWHVLDSSAQLYELSGCSQPLLAVGGWDSRLLCSRHHVLLVASARLSGPPPQTVDVQLFPAEPGARVDQCLWLEHTKQAVVVYDETRVCVVDPSALTVRAISVHEQHPSAERALVLCVTELSDGRVAVLRKDGEMSIFDVNLARLEQDEKNWRVLAGLSATDVPPADGSSAVPLAANVVGRKVVSRPSPAQPPHDGFFEQGGRALGGAGGGSGAASQGGAGAGRGGGSGSGSGPGSSGGDGVGIGGKRGIKREGKGGPPDPAAELNREIDEVQRAMSRQALEEELRLISMGRCR
jgi:hypothetical protein